MAKGLLLVIMEPPAPLEEEFHDWYDSEHLPQRLALPGFESGSRWVCLSGWPRWLAIYDLSSIAALDDAAYAAVSGQNSTPWSRRILPRTLGRQRIVAEQIYPSEALAPAPETICRLGLARYATRPGDVLPALQEAASRMEGLRQLRLFDDGNAIWVLAALSRPAEMAEYASLFAAGNAVPTLANLYAPYRRAWRRGDRQHRLDLRPALDRLGPGRLCLGQGGDHPALARHRRRVRAQAHPREHRRPRSDAHADGRDPARQPTHGR